MGNPFEERRYGRVEVNARALRDDYRAAVALFSRFVPYRVEDRFEADRLDYTGWSPDFDPIPEHEIAPVYRAIFTRAEDGSLSMTFEKRGY